MGEGAGGILLGDNKGREAVKLRPIIFQWGGVCISNEHPYL